MKKTYSTKRHKGFTFVEIMIVIAICALLASIAIPNILRSRDLKRAVSETQRIIGIPATDIIRAKVSPIDPDKIGVVYKYTPSVGGEKVESFTVFDRNTKELRGVTPQEESRLFPSKPGAPGQ